MIFAWKKFKPALTLVEVMVVVTILAVFATTSLIYLASGKRKAETRDAKRKKDIADITEALGFYVTATETYPYAGTGCDTSIGYFDVVFCSANGYVSGIPLSNWSNVPNGFYEAIIIKQQVLKNLPVDPKNDNTYHYKYIRTTTSTYWIGVKLEAPKNPQGNWFRCTDDAALAALHLLTIGCKEVGNFKW